MKPNVLDRIRELEAEKMKLMDEAKATALANAEKAINELNELGFNYRLVQGERAVRSASAPRGQRRTGIRDDVMSAIAAAGPDGINRQDLLAKMEATDKSAEQAVSNAVSALKKDGKISGEKGIYIAA